MRMFYIRGANLQPSHIWPTCFNQTQQFIFNMMILAKLPCPDL